MRTHLGDSQIERWVGDADPGQQDPVLWWQQQIRTGYRNPVEKKGLRSRSLSQREGP